MRNRVLSIVAALGFSLHILVPPGFMPASVSDGWHLQWCPDGMSAEVMHALFGHAHHHSADQTQTFAHCDLSGLYADVDLQSHALPPGDAENPQPDQAWVTLLHSPEFRSGYLSRAPPAHAPI